MRNDRLTMTEWLEHCRNETKPKIPPYRELSAPEIAMINEIQVKAEEVRELCEAAERHYHVDARWLAIGMTDLQKGFMCVIRSIERPEGF